MNFLAHLFLTGKNEPLLVGNFLGDFLTNRQVAALPHPIQQGVKIHRQIDAFTDSHEQVRRSAARLRPVHGKYAPVILDVFFDYILVENWQHFSAEPLGEFAGFAYATLEKHVHLMPVFLQERLPLMIADDWLVRYGMCAPKIS
jgi:acyl carrier protein phosphodiesterase